MDPDTVPDERAAAIETFVGDWAADEGMPGVSVAVTTDEGLAYAGGVGSRDLASNAPATADTVYGVGSVTKSFTALAVLQQQGSGRLDVEDPVTDHLAVDLPADAEPTLHDLLTHSSGIPSLGASSALIARRAGIGEAGLPLGDREDLYRHLAGADDEYDPGGRFMYCNTGYALLADVVEAVDGRAFPAYLADEVFDPLGMDRSTLLAEEFAAFEDAMTPYWFEDGDPEPTDLPVRELSYGPGGLLAPVTDLAAYLRMQLNGGQYDGAEVVDPDLLSRAHAGHVETPEGPYGYGWRTRELLGRDLVGHGGSIGVATAFAGFLPGEDLGVAVACNASPGYSLAHLGEGVAAVALGEDPGDVPFYARRRRIDRLTGAYEAYRGVRTATVEERGRTLAVTFEDELGGDRLTLVPEEPTMAGYRFHAFTPGGARMPVEFVVDDDGVDLFVERWRLHQV